MVTNGRLGFNGGVRVGLGGNNATFTQVEILDFEKS